jgi:hypothetical protein
MFRSSTQRLHRSIHSQPNIIGQTTSLTLEGMKQITNTGKKLRVHQSARCEFDIDLESIGK